MKATKRKRIPKVRVVKASGRPIQLRYLDPDQGREVRISTGTYDASEADEQRKDLEARLRLGEKPKAKATKPHGPRMSWETFREEYRRLRLEQQGYREKSSIAAESRLDLAERIIKPRVLQDMADRAALCTLQDELLAGAESRYDPPRQRSQHTVKSTVAAVVAALNWARKRGWLDSVPEFEKVSTSKLRAAKGRPITTEEFERMLEKTIDVVGADAAESWKHVLRGLWSSALRLDELLHVSWDISETIRPEWPRGCKPVLFIPADMQKNATEESIPLVPWFEAVLLETPEADRTGWVFNPQSLASQHKRKPRHGRPKLDWVSKVIGKIGVKARVVVHPGDESKGRKTKYASAHDLRRSCLERLKDSGIPAEVVQRVARHADYETTRKYYATGDVQKAAAALDVLKGSQDVPRYNRELQSS